MTNHYYSENPDTAHDFEEWPFELKGKIFRFVTDSGVFSRETVDYGSRVLIDAFDWEELPSEGKILDVGCGYGTLGLTLVKAKEVEATLVDINQRALDLARQNAERNQVLATIFQSNLYQNVEGRFHHIISNPPIRAGKQVVHEVITGSYTHLLDGGDLTIVIQKKQGAPSAKAKMEEVFGNCEILKKDKGYYILRSRKEI